MRTVAIFLLLAVAGAAAAQPAEIAAGRNEYLAGEFHKAAAHFQLALHADPQNAEAEYWLGRSYATLADIATPFGRHDRAMARLHYTRAVELSPNAWYRQELFAFLVDCGDLNRARTLLQSSETDPEYQSMRASLQETRRLNRSVNGRLTRAFQVLTAWR